MQVLLKQLQLKRSGQFITPKMLHLILNYLKQAYVFCVFVCLCLCVCACVHACVRMCVCMFVMIVNAQIHLQG